MNSMRKRRSESSRGSDLKRTRRRATFACARCHCKKIKCDRLKPSCSNCVQSKSECFGILDGDTKTAVPRSVVQYIQNAIAQKEIELQRFYESIRSPNITTEANSSNASSESEDCSNSAFTKCLVENFNPGTNSNFLNTDEGFPVDLFLLLPSVLPSGGHSLQSARDQSRDMIGARIELRQIPRGVAELLTTNYIENILPLYPFLDPDDIWDRFHRVYSQGESMEATDAHDIFIISTVLCISIMTSRFDDSSRIFQSSQRIFQNGLNYARELCRSSIKSLQGILLLAQYSYLMPQSASISDTVGLSMSMAVELGLHRDPEETMARTKLSTKEADLYRCIFWCIYEMDRSIAYTTYRRLSIDDALITTKYPSDKAGTCFRCVIEFRYIQSEIVSINYLGSDTYIEEKSCPYSAWLDYMEQKIKKWRQSITSFECAGPDWYDAAVHHGYLFLHRPSPRNPIPSEESLIKCFDAAAEVVAGYWEHAHSGFLKYNWHAMHQGFEGALVMLYALMKCESSLRERYGIRKILETVNLYSSLFALLSERWQPATACYQTYEQFKGSVLNKVMGLGNEPDGAVYHALSRLVLPRAAHADSPKRNATHQMLSDAVVHGPSQALVNRDFSGAEVVEGCCASPMVDQVTCADASYGTNSHLDWLDMVSDPMESLDWDQFGPDVFTEQSFMLWAL